MIRIAVTRPELPGDAVDALVEGGEFDVAIRPIHDALTSEEATKLTMTCDGIVATGMDRFELGAFGPGARLRVLSTTSVGYDQIDVGAAHRHGVIVTTVPATIADTCADYTFGLILSARRRIVETDRLIRAGAWNRLTMHEWLGDDVGGSRLGLIGFGDIGRAVARRAAGFDMDVVHHDRSGTVSALSRWMELEELLATSDIVSLHVPLTDATRGLIDERALGLMKRSATLVNTARGAVVDTGALATALRAGSLRSAALDVFEEEPFDDVDHLLMSLPNVVLSPHASAATTTTRAAMVARAVANVVAVLRGGTPLDPVVGDE